ncbi:transmembrane protein 174-like [Acipenser ruthenus]|uniref:transmembrane protein 174-like n=1 Tax=Acipenser ruthenus TaxID=7906 RepID=UPI00145A7D8D|nr:transmembrane protein 174-like [Acipenser ruthenus]
MDQSRNDTNRTITNINTSNGNNNTEDVSVNVFSVTPYLPSSSDIEVSDGDKAGATLLFSGVFLGLVGITFTVMGWIKYDGSTYFEWTQLLGPILLSVGVTFVLIAVCKFRMLTCKTCKQADDRVTEGEQPPCGQSFVFTGINQPITFHGATVVQYIPPPHGSPAQDGIVMTTASAPSANRSQSNTPQSGAPGTTICPPQYFTIFPLDNPSFVGEEHCPPYQRSNSDDCRADETQEEPDERIAGDQPHENLAPPPYEEIFSLSLLSDSTT